MTEPASPGEGALAPPVTAADTASAAAAPAEAAPGGRSTLREYAEAIVIALLIALTLRSFVVEAFKIPSGSMIPTLEIGDHIFVNKMSYRTEIPYSLLGVRFPAGGTTLKRWRAPARGDIVVFRYPSQPDVDYIKRVIGLPGDTVELRDNELFVNGALLPRAAGRGYTYTDQHCEQDSGGTMTETLGGRPYTILVQDGPHDFGDFGPVKVKPDHLFVMGDNRDNSSDSRVWGQVPLDNVKGRAMVTWLSLDGCGGPTGFLRLSRMFKTLH